MNIENFVKKQDSTLKRYQRIYILLDLVVIALLIYTLSIIFNMEIIFSMASTFELYAGSTYDILGSSVAFETLGLVAISLILSIIITAILHIRDKKLIAIHLIEERYPFLHDRLSTAYDNRHNSNIIVDDLLEKVSTDIKKVNSSEFLNKRRLGIGFALLIVTTSVFAYVTTNEIRSDRTPEDLIDIVENIPLISQGDEEGEELLPEIGPDGAEGEGGEDIFGEPAIVVVEGTEVDLTLPPGAGTGFTQEQEGEERTEEFERGSAYDITVISSQAYYEQLPEGHENIIKAYFEEIAKD